MKFVNYILKKRFSYLAVANFTIGTIILFKFNEILFSFLFVLSGGIVISILETINEKVRNKDNNNE